MFSLTVFSLWFPNLIKGFDNTKISICITVKEAEIFLFSSFYVIYESEMWRCYQCWPYIWCRLEAFDDTMRASNMQTFWLVSLSDNVSVDLQWYLINFITTCTFQTNTYLSCGGGKLNVPDMQEETKGCWSTGLSSTCLWYPEKAYLCSQIVR